MKATFLPDEITKLDPKNVARALRSAYETVCGVTPSRECVALMVAQSALETGRWKSIHRFNLGNVKASPTYEGFYTQFRCNEVINGKVEWFDPPHPQTNFRAYLGLEVAALDHIRFLQRPRYARAWQSLQGGQPLAFVEDLKRAGYFTADAGPYARAVTSLWKEYLAMLDRMREEDDTEPPPPPDDEPTLHDLALAAVAKTDVANLVREERDENLKEP